MEARTPSHQAEVPRRDLENDKEAALHTAYLSITIPDDDRRGVLSDSLTTRLNNVHSLDSLRDAVAREPHEEQSWIV